MVALSGRTVAEALGEEGQGKGAGTKSKRERFQWLPFINHHPQGEEGTPNTHYDSEIHGRMGPWTPITRFRIGEPHCATHNSLFTTQTMKENRERERTKQVVAMWTLSLQGERRDEIS